MAWAENQPSVLLFGGESGLACARPPGRASQATKRYIRSLCTAFGRSSANERRSMGGIAEANEQASPLDLSHLDAQAAAATAGKWVHDR